MWARQTSFIRRKRKINAFDFLVLITFGQLGLVHPSLAGMVTSITAKMSRIALHYRFTAQAVAFLHKCLLFVLQQKTRQTMPIHSHRLKPFKRIMIFDSSSWAIDPHFSSILPGAGGFTSSATCKVQAAYEYKQGLLCFSEVMPGTKQDNVFTDKLPELLQQGDLALTDLGYFKLKTFKRIEIKGAYYISKLRFGTTLIDPKTDDRIVLLKLLKKSPANQYQMWVNMGIKEPVRCRLVCYKVSSEVANNRRRQIRKTAKRSGKIPDQRHLALCDWTLMITNAPESLIPMDVLYSFYRIRWQIELVFKQLKSVLRINKCNTRKDNRLFCEIYGKLIMAALIHRIHAGINTSLWNDYGRELSMDKLYKRIQERAMLFARLAIISISALVRFLEKEIPTWIKNCMKSVQKSRKTTLQLIEFSSSCQSNLFSAAA